MIGGFAVIAHAHIRATRDIDFLIDDGDVAAGALAAAARSLDATVQATGEEVTSQLVAARDHVRMSTTAGIIDLVRGGLAPLDFPSVSAAAHRVVLEGEPALVADLATLVAFKRLASRPQDQADLVALQEIHGELPRLPVPGLDGAEGSEGR